MKAAYSLKKIVQTGKILVGEGLCWLTGWGLGKQDCCWWNNNGAKYLFCRTFQCSGKRDVLQCKGVLLLLNYSRPWKPEQVVGRIMVKQTRESSMSNAETPNVFQTLSQHVSLLLVVFCSSTWYSHKGAHWEKPPVLCFIPLSLPHGAPWFLSSSQII